jgi:hypothetical protein
MMKNSQFSKQIILTFVMVFLSAGIVFAATNSDITSLVSGFMRYTKQHRDGQCLNGAQNDYCYGYGWSGNLQAWGFGYGYKIKDYDETTGPIAANYGFDGNNGAATVDSVAVDKTTATITYSVNYLAKIAWVLAQVLRLLKIM